MRAYAVYGYFRPGRHSMTPSRLPDHHCFGGLRFPSRLKGVKNCPHAPGGPSRLLNHPHHAKIKPGLKPGVSLNRRGRPGCAWKDYWGSGMCTPFVLHKAMCAGTTPRESLGSTQAHPFKHAQVANRCNPQPFPIPPPDPPPKKKK